jgi:hypothetical protein
MLVRTDCERAFDNCMIQLYKQKNVNKETFIVIEISPGYTK